MSERFDRLLGDERTAEVTTKGLADLRRLFGTLMAVDALAGDPVAVRVPLIGPVFVRALPDPAQSATDAPTGLGCVATGSLVECA